MAGVKQLADPVCAMLWGVALAHEILRQRLHNQQLTEPRNDTPEAVVRSLVAVQAQDYGGAAWAVGQRLRSGTRDAVDAALASGSILRTHVLRPTWHLVAREDIGWLLQLTGPRLQQTQRVYHDRLGITDAILDRSATLVTTALRGNQCLTSKEIASLLAGEGIAFTDFGHLLALQHLELDGIICSGPLRGRQHTYALLDERAPTTRPGSRDEAIAALAMRYFQSHGPASLRDFVWWSGLRVADARAGLAAVAPSLSRWARGPTELWGPPPAAAATAAHSAHLLPNYDEYTVAYRDRSEMLLPGSVDQAVALRYVALRAGTVVGTWAVREARRGRTLTVSPLRRLTTRDEAALSREAGRYAAFTGAEVALRFLST